MEHINKTEIARNVLIQAFLLTMKDSQYDMLTAMQDFIRLKPDKMLQTLRGNSKYLTDWAINEWIPEEDEKTPSTIQEGVQQVKLAALECGIPQLASEIASLEQELQRIKKFIEFAEIDKRATEDSGQTKETELQKRQASKVRKAMIHAYWWSYRVPELTAAIAMGKIRHLKDTNIKELEEVLTANRECRMKVAMDGRPEGEEWTPERISQELFKLDSTALLSVCADLEKDIDYMKWRIKRTEAWLTDVDLPNIMPDRWDLK